MYDVDYVSVGTRMSCFLPTPVMLRDSIIEEEVFVGAGVTIVIGEPGRPLVVGAGAKISAGAVVTESIPPNASVASSSFA